MIKEIISVKAFDIQDIVDEEMEQQYRKGQVLLNYIDEDGDSMVKIFEATLDTAEDGNGDLVFDAGRIGEDQSTELFFDVLDLLTNIQPQGVQVSAFREAVTIWGREDMEAEVSEDFFQRVFAVEDATLASLQAAPSRSARKI